MDYGDVMDIFQFPPGSVNGNQECADVVIINDDIFEKLETFAVILSSTEENVFVGPQSSVAIKDDEGRLCTPNVTYVIHSYPHNHRADPQVLPPHTDCARVCWDG